MKETKSGRVILYFSICYNTGISTNQCYCTYINIKFTAYDILKLVPSTGLTLIMRKCNDEKLNISTFLTLHFLFSDIVWSLAQWCPFSRIHAKVFSKDARRNVTSWGSRACTARLACHLEQVQWMTACFTTLITVLSSRVFFYRKKTFIMSVFHNKKVYTKDR